MNKFIGWDRNCARRRLDRRTRTVHRLRRKDGWTRNWNPRSPLTTCLVRQARGNYPPPSSWCLSVCIVVPVLIARLSLSFLSPSFILANPKLLYVELARICRPNSDLTAKSENLYNLLLWSPCVFPAKFLAFAIMYFYDICYFYNIQANIMFSIDPLSHLESFFSLSFFFHSIVPCLYLVLKVRTYIYIRVLANFIKLCALTNKFYIG